MFASLFNFDLQTVEINQPTIVVWCIIFYFDFSPQKSKKLFMACSFHFKKFAAKILPAFSARLIRAFTIKMVSSIFYFAGFSFLGGFYRALGPGSTFTGPKKKNYRTVATSEEEEEEEQESRSTAEEDRREFWLARNIGS